MVPASDIREIEAETAGHGCCGPGALWGWSPPPLPADTEGKRRVDRVLPRSGLTVVLFFAAVVALLNVGLFLPARADLAATGLASLAAGSWCALNFWRSRHAHCAVTGAGWLALAAFAFVEAGLGHSLIHGDEGLVFLAVLGVGLLFEGAWYVARRTNAITRTSRPFDLQPVASCSLSDGDLGERVGTWRAFLTDHRLEGREIPGGIRLTLRGSPVATATLQRLVSLERSCCPWISWSISGGSVLEVDATAAQPEEVRALRSWMSG